jgi:hypothetical protein
MKANARAWPLKTWVYTATAVLGILFMVLTYASRGTGHNHESLLLRLSIALPELVIWAVAIMSAVRFKEYAHSIRETQDGGALNLIANSLLVLVLYVIFLSSGDAIKSLFVNSPHLKTAVTLSNYLPLVIAFISSVLIYRGSKHLSKIISAPPWDSRRLVISALPFFLLLFIYAWQFYKAVPTLKGADGLPRFTQSPGVLLVTYVLPHLVLWGLGLLACFNIARFAVTTKGLIYKALFRNLYQGLILVFVCIFTAQLIIISPINLEKFNIWLALAYAVLVAAVFGFGLIYRGVQQLDRIEKAVRLRA